MTKPKLDIKRELLAIDNKDYNFYDNLSEDERKNFSPYILMRYISNVQSNNAVQEWFLIKTNDAVNKHHWLLSKKHKPLLWKLFSTVGVGQVVYHPYLGAGKKEKANKIEKLIAELYPTMKIEDIKLMASMMTDQDKQNLFDKMGFDKKQQKEYE